MKGIRLLFFPAICALLSACSDDHHGTEGSIELIFVTPNDGDPLPYGDTLFLSGMIHNDHPVTEYQVRVENHDGDTVYFSTTQYPGENIVHFNHTWVNNLTGTANVHVVLEAVDSEQNHGETMLHINCLGQ